MKALCTEVEQKGNHHQHFPLQKKHWVKLLYTGFLPKRQYWSKQSHVERFLKIAILLLRYTADVWNVNQISDLSVKACST